LEDRRISAKPIAEQLGISRERDGSIIHEDLDMRKVTKGVLFLHDNAPAHWALATQKKLAYLGFQYPDHPPYSPDLAQSDYHLFPGLRKQLKGRHFSTDAEVSAAAETWLDGQLSEFFFFGWGGGGLQALEQRAKKCIELRGEYVE
jgi:histone-lysine N-methyltransferase SETMAR